MSTLCRKDQRFHLWSPWNASGVRGERQCQFYSQVYSKVYSQVLQHWEMEEWRQEAVSMHHPTPSRVHLGCGAGEKEEWRLEVVSLRPTPSWAVEWVRRKSGGWRLLACAFVPPPHGRNWAVQESLWLMQWEGVAFSLLFIVFNCGDCLQCFPCCWNGRPLCACGIVSCSPPPVCYSTVLGWTCVCVSAHHSTGTVQC